MTTEKNAQDEQEERRTQKTFFLPEVAVRNPVTIAMCLLALLMLGGISYFTLNVDMLPTIDPPAISVITVYPGASASDVESEVTKYLEDNLSTVPNLDEITSTSKDNLSVVTCSFNWGTDLDVASNDIREKIDLAKKDLADGAEDPYLFKFSSSMMPVMVFSIVAEESSSDLFQIVDKQIADPLKRVPGVGAIIYSGAIERQINVAFDRGAIEARRLSLQQIQSAIEAENIDIPAGTVKVDDQELQLRVIGRFDDLEQIANTVVGVGTDGAVIRLRDVADVRDAHEEAVMISWGAAAGENARRGMAIIVQKQSGANTVNVIEAIKERMEELKDEIPADIEIITITDDSESILAMIKNLTNSVLVGGVLVVLVCFFFLRRLRTSLVIALTVPLSLITAFIGLFLMDYTINIISLMSLSIAMGMVVDDAIVVLENTVRHVDMGEPPRKAAVKAASEVGLAVVATTLVTVVVFAPLLLAGGIVGVIFGQLSFVVIVTVSASTLVALTFTPMACSRLLKKENGKKTGRFYQASENFLNGIERKYARLLEWCLTRRKRVFAGILAVFAASFLLLSSIGTEFMSHTDSGEISITVELAQGTRVERTAEIAQMIMEHVRKIPEVRCFYGVAGQSKEGLMSAVGNEEGPNIARVGIRLVDLEHRGRSAEEVAIEIRPWIEMLPGVVNSSVQAVGTAQKLFFGGGGAIDIQVLGHDMDETNEIAARIKEIVESVPGTADVSISRKEPRPEIHVSVDRDKASLLGVNTAIVGSTIRASYYGNNNSTFRNNGDDFDIELRLNEEERNSVDQIGSLPITTMTGEIISLRNIATIGEGLGPVEIDRKNRVRVVSITASTEGRVLGDIVNDINRQLDQLDLPPGVTLEWGGDVDQQSESFRDLTLLLILGVILVYMVMASQFEDFLDPFVIMFSIPFAFTGVIWAFALTGTTLSLMSFIGLVMLAGIVVKNAIVLVDYIKQLREIHGYGLKDAIIAGGRTRLRPVLMTTLTTIFGMLPLALSSGMGSEMWNALGVTVISGLSVSTLVTLILVPLVYSVVHNRRLKHRQQKQL